MIKSYFTNKYLYLFVLLPVFIIPFIQTKLLLDTSLHLRFLVLNIFITLGYIFLFFSKRINKIHVTKFLIFYSIYAVYSIISVFISTNYSDAFFQFAMILNLGFIVFFYYIIFSIFSYTIKNIALAFNIICFVVIILTFIDYFDIYSTTGITHKSLYNINATFSHKNILSEVLFVLFPFALYLLSAKNKWIRIFGIINCTGILFFIIILLTRAVWLSMIIGFLSTISIYIIISGKNKALLLLKNKKTYIFLISFVFTIFLSLIIYSRTDNFDTIKKSLLKIFVSYDSSQHRKELWKRSLNIAKEKPILGNGLGTWRIEVLKYGSKNLQSENNITFYQRPHNDFLWVLSEQGIIGLILFLSFFVIIFYKLVKILKQQEPYTDKYFYYLMFCLLIGYVVFSCFSFPKERIEHNLFLGIIFGLILSKDSSINKKEKTMILKNMQLKIVFILILILLIFNSKIAYTRFLSEYHLKKAFVARSESNFDNVINEINETDSYFYKIDPFSTPVRWYSGEAFFMKSKLEKAFDEYQKCYAINPYHIHVLNNLATCYEIKGYHEKAINLYKNAIDISPKFDDALLNLTAIYYNAGSIDSATCYLYKIDTICKNEKYLPFLETILKKRIENKIKAIDNKEIVKLLNNIKKNSPWIMSIYKKSKINCLSFDKQLVLDCIFVMKNIDKSIDEKEYKVLLKKYN